MPRVNGVQTQRLRLTVGATTDRVISHIVGLGIYGASEATVACSIIRYWLWANQDKLRENRITLAPVQPVPDR
jgi:hypothetical protein